MQRRTLRSLACALAFSSLSAGCASHLVAVEDRSVRDDLDGARWMPAQADDLLGPWRLARISGAAAAVLLDLSYFIAPDARFSGSALYAGPPAHYEVLDGTWSLGADGALQLGVDSAPARVEVAGKFLRLSGAEGSLVFERPAIR